MDVARAAREEQATVEQQFQQHELQSRIRERLVAAQAATGEPATPAEIDAAIERYFESQYVYRDPPLNGRTLCAHLYVRRRGLMFFIGILVLISAGLWLVLSPRMPWASSQRNARAVAAAADHARTQLAALSALALDEAARRAVTQLTTEFQAADASHDRDSIETIHPRIIRLRTILEEEYDLTIVSGTGHISLVERIWESPTGQPATAYYVIVEAVDRGGKILSRSIRSSEGQPAQTVTQWGEQVSQAVFDRLVQDKAADGILNEIRFAEKRRGFQSERVILTDSKQQPIPRQGQITQW